MKIDSGHKNRTVGFYPKSLRPFLRIFVDDSNIYIIHAEGAPRALARCSIIFVDTSASGNDINTFILILKGILIQSYED